MGKEATYKWYLQNKQRVHATNQRIRDEKAAFVQQIKNVPCADCKQRFPYYVMDLDHIKGDKLFEIGGSYKQVGWKRLEEEVAKCEVVCSNCHRIRTQMRLCNSMVE